MFEPTVRFHLLLLVPPAVTMAAAPSLSASLAGFHQHILQDVPQHRTGTLADPPAAMLVVHHDKRTIGIKAFVSVN